MSSLSDHSASRTRVKICGITNLEDARHAAASGADYLGYILFERSPRFVGADAIRGITMAIRAEFPDVRHVGVFVNEDLEVLTETVAAARLDIAQLHGSEPASYCTSLATRGYPFMRAMRFGPTAPRVDWREFPAAEFYLCDTYDPKQAGGTGKGFDLTLLPSDLPIERTFLAGGLTPENVGGAVMTLQPYAVDVVSGVEAGPGKKDLGKVQAFIDAVRMAASRT